MLLSAISPQTLLSSNHHNTTTCNNLSLLSATKPHHHHCTICRAANTSVHCNNNPNSTTQTLRHVSVSTTRLDEPEDGGGAAVGMVSSASAVAAAIRKASTSPVEFVERIEKDCKNKGLVLPSSDFQRLCLEQLDLFRRIVDSDAILSVYVRPAGSYVMDRLELRRVTFYPGRNAADIVIVIGNFSIPTGLRAAEASLLSQQAEFVPEYRAFVFPMVKHPFVVGFLVAELPQMESGKDENVVKQCPLPEESYAVPPFTDSKSWKIQNLEENPLEMHNFTAEQRLSAINISRSIAMAYVMDQKAMLLQQSSWQNNVRMSNLVEQIRGPLSSIRTLSKVLSLHTKSSEISSDIVEDILVQGDHMRETLQQLQDAVYLTKANIVQYNEENLMKMHDSTHSHPEFLRSQLPNIFSKETARSKTQESGGRLSVTSTSKDIEMPMPPLALSPLQQQNIRPCNVSDVLSDLVGALEPLAQKQQRVVELCELSQSLEVAVEEPAMRQALSNLIEGALLRTNVGGMVEIISTGAPAGGALVIIDDDGPDMHYMTQMHMLTPYGSDLFSKEMVEDNMAWNFVAGLTVAREILESYGCVIRVISPRSMEAALGAGGTRIELWLPSFSDSPDLDGTDQVA